MTEPRKQGSVWPGMPFMRGPQGADRLRQWLSQSNVIHAATLSRRERVLAHPWACKRLCEIFGYKRPQQWTGFVPPARGPDGELNTSPYRRALMELLHDVEEADKAIADLEVATAAAETED